MTKKEPWVIAREQEEADRVKNVKKLQGKLSEEQMAVMLELCNIVREFDCDYCEDYELYDATIPRRMVEIRARFENLFHINRGHGYQGSTW